MYLLFFRLFCYLCYYRILSRVPCAIQSLLIIHFKYSSGYVSILNSLAILSLLPSTLVTINSFSKSVSLFLFHK